MRDKNRLIEIALGAHVMLGPDDLTRGAYSGKETTLYYNSGTEAIPVWEQMIRIRNVTFNDGPSLNDVEFHGAAFTSQIPGYKAFNGSLEYVMKRGADAVYAEIKTASELGTIEDWLYLNDDISVDGSIGWRSPIILGEFANSSNGGDPVVETMPFSMADAYNAQDEVVTKIPVTTTGGVPAAQGVFAVLAAQTIMAKVKDHKERLARIQAVTAELVAAGIQSKNGVTIRPPARDFVPASLADLVGKQKAG